MRLILPLAIALVLSVQLPAHAQHQGHVMPMPPAPVVKKKPAAKAVAKPAVKSTLKAPAKPAAKKAPAPKRPKTKAIAPSEPPAPKPASPAAAPAAVDHSTMDHSQMQGMDHSTMDHSAKPLLTPVPPVTQADREAAFPDLHAHHQHGTSIQSYWLIDRLEVSDADDGTALGWEAAAWIGGDIQRLWLRSEGEAVDGRIEHGDVEVLYGRSVRAWWDVLAGVRQDVGEGPSRTWGAIGVQGLAPYKFEVAATAYLGEGGRTALRAEVEYDTLLTNRLILQWRAEANAHGKDDPIAGIGAGLSTVEAGARLRYEITRQFAPYIGIEHDRAFGNTAELRRASGHGAGDTRFVAGVRAWF